MAVDQRAIYTLICAGISLIALYLFRRLQYLRLQQYSNLPQPEISLLWGHLKWIGLAFKRYQCDPAVHLDVVLQNTKAQYGDPPVLFMDMRPISYPILCIYSHEVAEQVSRPSKTYAYSVPKSPTLGEFFPLIGYHSILASEGEEWKSQRKRLNPGFAPQHLMTLLPAILDKTEEFLQLLDGYAASGEAFRLADLCTNLTFDIIGAVTMDMDFHAQKPGQECEVLVLFKQLVGTFNTYGRSRGIPGLGGFLARRKRAALARQLEVTTKGKIRSTFAEMQQHQQEQEQRGVDTADSATKSSTRSVLGLSLIGVDELTPAFLQQTSDNLRTFLFAGHDTTSIILQWAFYQLARCPRALTALRKELDDLLGADDTSISTVRERLLGAKGDGEVLSRMPYTSAVIKETLRLHPPAGSARMIPPGTNLKLALPGGGPEFVADGMVLYLCHTVLQRDKAVYGETADDFVPERWLSGGEDNGSDNNSSKTSIPAGAWRPFERGPRSCIGQELANIEAKVIMACAVRRYDLTKVGLGEFELDEKGRRVLDEKGYCVTKSDLYNTSRVTAAPADWMMMKVELSEQAARA